MNRKRKVTALVALLTAVAGLGTACLHTKEGSGSAGTAGAASEQGKAAGIYPLRSTSTLTYWAELNQNAASVKASFDEVPFFQEWQKRTGVRLKFLRPPANQEKTALNVMLASGDLPDMIEYGWTSIPGGPEKAISDGYLLRLNEVFDKYAPNLKKYLKEHPEVDKQIKTDEGSYFVFPFIRGDELLKTFQGPIIRKDWLDELGLPVPTTIDEWHTVLTAFKEQKGAEAPLTFLGVPYVLFGLDSGAFTGAFGVRKGFYADNGKMKFGAIEPGYKEFLATFRQWYQEGLIDRNVATVDTKTMDSNMRSGRSGATVWNAGSGIGQWQTYFQEKDSKAKVAPAPYPVLKKGEKPKFGQKSHSFVGNGSVAISAKSKHVEEAARMLDYGYSAEGHLFFNFGIEGISYNMENGVPMYTDLIMHHPDKLAPSQALAMYNRASYFGPFVQDLGYVEQYYTMPQQKEALKIWADTETDIHMPPVATKTEKESAEYASIMLDVNTLVDEMTLKLMLGSEPLDSFDTYVAKIKSLRIDRAIQIEQQTLDRFNKR